MTTGRAGVSTETPARLYPAHVVISPGAERYIDRLALDLATGVVELHQLPPSLYQFYVLAYDTGNAARQPEIDRLNWDADRLYAEVCRRPPARDQERIDDYLAALQHRGADAAAQRAAEIRAYIGGTPDDRWPDSITDQGLKKDHNDK